VVAIGGKHEFQERGWRRFTWRSGRDLRIGDDCRTDGDRMLTPVAAEKIRKWAQCFVFSRLRGVDPFSDDCIFPGGGD